MVPLRSAVHHAELLSEAWALPVAQRYSPLQPQALWSICGPTSVANVLRSLGVKSGRNPLRGFGLRAMTLDQLVTEASEVAPAGWTVTAVRPRSVDELRAELRGANQEPRRYVVNFHRAAIFGHGGGHHSPLGGFLEREDLAFVLDVNASFGPWLVPTQRLFEAITPIDDQPAGRVGWRASTGSSEAHRRLSKPLACCEKRRSSALRRAQPADSEDGRPISPTLEQAVEQLSGRLGPGLDGG